MADHTVRVALVAGPMYDPLYETVACFEQTTGLEVDVAHRSPHGELNAHLASLDDMPYDLISTHTKYAPSQLSFLAAIDDFAEQVEVASFYPLTTDLAKVGGQLFGIPRNIDVKLLHYRTDLVDRVPASWDELAETARKLGNRGCCYGFDFTGMGSGLFGMFFELAEMGGTSLFPVSDAPLLNSEGGAWALQLIRKLYRSGAAPVEVANWQYDEAHRFFRDGHAAMICDWPGYYGAYRDAVTSRVSNDLGLARMPVGPTGIHKAYAGCHTFALTRHGIKKPGALELLRFLTAPKQQLVEARQGAVPTRPAVLAEIVAEAKGLDGERWRLLDLVIANDMLIPPRLACYPEIEDTIWRTVRSVMTGEFDADEALDTMERRIRDCHVVHSQRGRG